MKIFKKLIKSIKYKIKQKELNSKNVYYDKRSGNYYTFNVTTEINSTLDKHILYR